MMLFQEKVFNFIRENRMIEDGDTVVAGLSGGADSVCLFLLLEKYRSVCPFTLTAAHVHHGLRKNADGDEAYVRELCDRYNVPLKLLHIDARAVSGELGVSVEEAGRIKRYEFFREVLSGSENGKTAVAHHRDDLCETMLFQLFRGSGISGIRGILPVSGNIIRPLLDVSREEIERYLTEEGISWRTDESNEELTYARNRIRHEILPVAEEITPCAKEHMAESAKRFREIEEYIKIQTAAEKEKYFRYAPSGKGTEKGSILLLNEIANLPKALSGELILEALTEVAGKKRDIGLVQVEAVRELFFTQVGRRRDFIYGLLAEREYEGVRIAVRYRAPVKEEKNENPEVTGDTEIKVIPDGGEFCPGSGYICRARLIPDPDLKKIPEDSYTKWLNYDTINNCLVFRRPRGGDYLVINKEGGRKPLKDYFVNEKIPAGERMSRLVLADGDRILWVVGLRIGEDAKITGNTKTAIEISIKEDPFYGRAY